MPNEWQYFIASTIGMISSLASCSEKLAFSRIVSNSYQDLKISTTYLTTLHELKHQRKSLGVFIDIDQLNDVWMINLL